MLSSCRHRFLHNTKTHTAAKPSLRFRFASPPFFYCSAICEFAKKKKPEREKTGTSRWCKVQASDGCRLPVGEKSQRERDLRFFLRSKKGAAFLLYTAGSAVPPPGAVSQFSTPSEVAARRSSLSFPLFRSPPPPPSPPSTHPPFPFRRPRPQCTKEGGKAQPAF